MSNKRFNIRVYGIYINDENKVLLTDEYRGGYEITKFPGGGLEHGEGTIDCLKRECLEEFGQEFEVIDHFYTTDFYQQSVFNPDHQIISIYYLIKPKEELRSPVKEKLFDFEKVEGAQSFRWMTLKDLKEEDFTFPIDRVVAKMLKAA